MCVHVCKLCVQTLVQDTNPTHPPGLSTHIPFLWDINTNIVMGPSGKIKKKLVHF